MNIQLVPKTTTESKSVAAITKREATQGRVLKLPKSVKRVAATIIDKGARRHYLNMQLDVVRSALDRAHMKRSDRKDSE